MALLPTFLAGFLLFTTFSARVLSDDFPTLSDLNKAIIAGDVEQVKKLIAQGADVNAPNAYWLTPMNYAVSINRSDMVAILAQNKANLTWMGENGRSYLDLAVLGNFTDSLRGLLQAGLSADLRDEMDETPIRVAVEYDSPAPALVLAEFGADLHQRWGDKNITLLHWAAEMNSAKSVDFLVSKGLDVNATDTMLWTPLHYAAAGGVLGNVEAAGRLVNHGACINCNSTEGYTPLKVAQIYQKQWMEFFLTQAGGTD